MDCAEGKSNLFCSTLRWALVLPVAAAAYAAVRLGVVAMLPHLNMPLPGALGGWVLSDWVGCMLFIVFATLVAPSHKQIAACGAFLVLSIAHCVMLMEATKHTIAPQHSTETIYLTAFGGFFVSIVLTGAIVQHYRQKAREVELTADARRYYREWAGEAAALEGAGAGSPAGAGADSGSNGASGNAQGAAAGGGAGVGGAAAQPQAEMPAPVPQYETKVLADETLPREMTINVSLSFDDEGGRQKYTVADGKPLGFVRTALLLGILSPGQALRFVFKSKKAKKRALLNNPPWFKKRREIDADLPDAAIESSETDGSRLLTDSLNEYRR
jgi:hypothetical protein